MHVSVGRLLETYGYWVVFLFVGIESLGIPLPGETALVTAAAFAALGHLSILGVIATAAAGAVIGDAGGYWIGRTGGLTLVRKYGRIIRFDDAKLDRVRAFFSRHGPKAVFFGRFIALLRTWAAILAGTALMPYGTFTLYNVLGGVSWAIVFGSLGFFFGKSLPLLERYIGQASLAVVLLFALVASIAIAWKWIAGHGDLLVQQGARAWGSVAERFPRGARFVVARFAREEYLGLHLTFGFLVSVAGLWLFAGVTEDVIHRDPLTRFDVTLLFWIRNHSTSLGDSIFQLVSAVGSPAAMLLIALGGAVLLVWKRSWVLLTGWLVSFAGAAFLSTILKLAIKRPRPPGASVFLRGDTFSFPSSHALGSLVGYGMLAYLVGALYLRTSRDRWLMVLAVAILIAAIGISRLYLGVHYFSDVVAGYAAGTLWLFACISGLEVVRRKQLIDSSLGMALPGN